MSCCFWSPKPSTLYHGWFGQNRAVNENQALAQHMHTQRYLGHVYNGQISDEASRCFPHGSIYMKFSNMEETHVNLSTCTHLDMVAHKTTKQIWKASNKAGFVCLHPHTRKHTQEKEVGHEMSQCEKWMIKYFKIKAARWAVIADGKLLSFKHLSSCQVNAHIH